MKSIPKRLYHEAHDALLDLFLAYGIPKKDQVVIYKLAGTCALYQQQQHGTQRRK